MATQVTSFLTRDREGRRTRYQGRHFLSTLPIRDLIRAMNPAAPAEVIHAAESLKYRDFLTVVLIVDRAETFPDNWIYIHEPQVTARPDPELQELVARPRPRPDQDQPGPRVLLLRGGRPVDDARRRFAGAGPPRDRLDRPGLGRRRSSTAASSACPRPIRSTTTYYQAHLARDPRLAQEPAQPRARRSKRHAQVQ